MKAITEQKTTDASTEQKIKEAARRVFIQKGFAATRTRDIAEEAGMNLALLNYYFRSKQRLFEIIMVETMAGFVQGMITVINDPETSLEEKIEEMASRYIDLLIEEPEIPTFLVTEIRNNPSELLKKIPVRENLMRSVLFKQFMEAVASGRIKEENPLHFLLNMIAMIVFPFIVKPVILQGAGLDTSEYNNMMMERKKLIPIWLKTMV